MKKELFITTLVVLFVWGGVAFGADTCPDVTGIWEGTLEAAFDDGSNTPDFYTLPISITIETQNGCIFSGTYQSWGGDIGLVGSLRKISPTQFAVTIQYRHVLLWGTTVIEGTLTCTTISDRRLALPPSCSTMSTSFKDYQFDPHDGGTYGIGTINFTKQ